eukprot:scaffold41812_cov32-Tisochrysis_lutea.AAC.2
MSTTAPSPPQRLLAEGSPATAVSESNLTFPKLIARFHVPAPHFVLAPPPESRSSACCTHPPHA